MTESATGPIALVKVFISYSRKDLNTAEHLRDRLVERNFEAFLDKHDILPGEPWQERLAKLIESADSVIFLLSPASVASEVCDWEVNEAERLGKRILPLVIEDTDAQKTPGRLKRLNYVFMRKPAEVAEGLELLSSAILTDIEWIREHTRLGGLAHRWAKSGARDDHLLRGEEVSLSENWATRRPLDSPGPSEVTLEFIAASRALATKTARRNLRRSRAIAFASLVTAAIMAGLGWSFYSAWQTGMINQSRLLASRAIQAAGEGDVYTAQLLATEALPDKRASWFSEERWRPYVETAWGTLTSGMLMRLSLGGHDDTVRRAIYSPDGDRILTASNDGTARLWDSDGNLLNVLDKHDDTIWDAAFRHDGLRIATASGDGTVQLWTDNGAFITALHTVPHLPEGTVAPGEDPPSVEKVAFSPDGGRIVAAGSANQAFLWDSEGHFLTLLAGHQQQLQDVVFSADGKHILTASNDGTARLWRASDGHPLVEFGLHSGPVWTAVFNPSGTRVLTVSKDATAKLWSVEGTLLRTLSEHRDNIWTGAFTPDGSHIVTVSADETARLWSSEGAPLRVLDEYDDETPSAITFSSDGERMIISSNFGVVMIFDTKGGFLSEVGTYGQTVGKGAVFSSDRRFILGPSGNQATELEYIPDPQTFIERTKETVPVCLPAERRRAMFLQPEPPQWCVDLGKPPYGNVRPQATWQEPLIARVLASE